MFQKVWPLQEVEARVRESRWTPQGKWARDCLGESRLYGGRQGHLFQVLRHWIPNTQDLPSWRSFQRLQRTSWSRLFIEIIFIFIQAFKLFILLCELSMFNLKTITSVELNINQCRTSKDSQIRYAKGRTTMKMLLFAHSTKCQWFS